MVTAHHKAPPPTPPREPTVSSKHHLVARLSVACLGSKETKQIGLVQGPPASPQCAVVSDYIYGATGGCLDWLIYTAAQELIR